MSTFHLFIIKEELDELLSQFSLQYDLSGALLQIGHTCKVFDPKTPPSPWRFRKVDYSFYLFPQGTECHKDSRIRDEGWVTVDTGFLGQQNTTRILTLTAIQATDGHPNRLASRMRSHLNKKSFQLRKGVRGRNVKYGGECIYNLMLYSPQARLLHNEGVSWVYEKGNNSVFDPVDLSDPQG